MSSGRSWSHSGPYKLLHFAATLCVAQCYLSGSWRYLLSAFPSLYSLSLSQSLHSQAMSAVMRKTSITLPDIGDEAYKIAEGCTGNLTLPVNTECVIQTQILDLVLNSWCHWNPPFLTDVSPVIFPELLTKPKLARRHLDDKTVATEGQDDLYLQSILILY